MVAGMSHDIEFSMCHGVPLSEICFVLAVMFDATDARCLINALIYLILRGTYHITMWDAF